MDSDIPGSNVRSYGSLGYDRLGCRLGLFPFASML